MITSITHVAGSNRIAKVGTKPLVFDTVGNLKDRQETISIQLRL
ncbi:MAG: hypothetical protein R3E34_10325 [Rhodocyclaceae bacterium]